MGNNFKKGIDRQMWVPVASAPNAHAAGMGLACDLRNSLDRNPFIFQLASATVLNRYNAITKAWNFVGSPALAGTFGAGSGAIFAPSQSHATFGVLAAGSTTTTVVLSTALAAAVGTNMLANRGGSGDYGFKIRITGLSAGGSGKTEERWIIANTSGTTPTIEVDSAFTFTPAANDRYEILGGRVLMLNAGTLAAGSWKFFDVATNNVGNRTQTNLPATVSTDFSAVCLDELHVPYNRKPGEGFLVGAGTYDNATKNCLTATNSAVGSLTGQAASGDAAVLSNEYRNFQIRIVEDTAIPTAVGQRRIIASHTAGASPVYTLGSNWTVTPSTTAKYVIELPNLILLWTTASTTTYTYNYGQATVNNGTASINADAWSTTYFGVRPGAMGAGCTSFGSWGIVPDTGKNARHSVIFSFRGGGVSTLDTLDIAAAIAGTWTGTVVYDGQPIVMTTGSSGKYCPFGNEGRFAYINFYTASAVNQMFRFDVKNRVLCNVTPTDVVQAGTAAVGDRVACLALIDGSTTWDLVFLVGHLSVVSFEFIPLV